jgi:hypothetical protein
MELTQIAETSFVLLDDDITAASAKEILQSTDASHLIIYQQHQGQGLYYLFSIRDVLDQLEESEADEVPLKEIFDLEESSSTPILEGSSSAEAAPDRCVIVDEGYLIGFFDADQPPPEVSRGLNETTRNFLTVDAQEEQPAEQHLQVEFPDQVPLDETTSLLIYLTNESLGRQEIPLSVAEGTVLDIVIQTRRCFQIEGKSSGQIKVTGGSESLPLLFKLKSTEIGQGDIRVLVFQNGCAIGSLKLRPIVVAEPGERLRANPVAHHHMVSTMNVAGPDLSLHIEETSAGGKKGFRVRLTATNPELDLNLKEYGPLTFEVEPGPYFDEFYKDIEMYGLSSPEEKEIALHDLEGKGAYLFSTLFPPEAQKKLWEIRDKISTVFIQSSEPWIPWELCKLSGVENGKIVEGPFFCEAYAVTRWMPGIGLKPRLKFQNMAIVVPADSGLAFAASELNYLLSLAGENRKVTRVPARYGALREAFRLGEYDVWHFSGHGAAREKDPDRAVMLLENNEKFFPQRISGDLLNVGLARPLIFFNACQIGRSGLSLVDIGGWARRFLLAGAGAFIGAYWSVYDQPAFKFAQELYQRMLGGIPIGEAARQARLAIRSTGDPTWLAYTVFAHPLARVQTGISPEMGR